MPREPVTINLDRGGEPKILRLELDGEQGTQGAMLYQIAHGQPYEPAITMLLASDLTEGDVFVDVGAHIGYFTILAAGLVGSTGKVLAFEPEPTNYEQLLRHIKLNDLSNVVVFNWAVGDHPGVVDLYVNRDNDGGHALWDVGRHPVNQQS